MFCLSSSGCWEDDVGHFQFGNIGKLLPNLKQPKSSYSTYTDALAMCQEIRVRW